VYRGTGYEQCSAKAAEPPGQHQRQPRAEAGDRLGRPGGRR